MRRFKSIDDFESKIAVLLGTIIAELLGRRPLFLGKDTVEQIDQLCTVLGKPPDTFINCCRKPEIRHYLRQLEIDDVTPLEELYPHCSRNAIDMISSLLCYDPKLRMTAKQALRHPYLQKYNKSPPCPRHKLPATEFLFEHTIPSIEQLRDELLMEGESICFRRHFTK